MKVPTSLRLDSELLEYAKALAEQDSLSVAGIVERVLREARMRRAVRHAATIEQVENNTSGDHYDQLAAEYVAIDGPLAAQ